MRLAPVLLILISLAPGLQAQQLLKGRIYDAKTDSLLSSATIFNATRKAYALSSRSGEYQIAAEEGDKVIISSVGYLPDTVKVLNFMIDAGYDVTMNMKETILKNVTVNQRNYKADSMERREGYSAFYDKPKEKLVSKNGPSNGVGMAFSPIGFFSRKAKDHKMNKKLEYQEEQEFIDYSFSKRYVETMTGLHGDSLHQFMILYRPTYEFCRNANNEDMLMYVNEKLKLYLKHEEAEEPKKKKN